MANTIRAKRPRHSSASSTSLQSSATTSGRLRNTINQSENHKQGVFYPATAEHALAIGYRFPTDRRMNELECREQGCSFLRSCLPSIGIDSVDPLAPQYW